ncbi:VanZ family protein [Virgibacillus profundi]|uniref:VanZ family protein n=1 Tax=Virgibacillus profundi TaxID=2024555 RepID=A0A2A2IIT2_9BACI|nr:VanZ family protein [Virgibacillus profundi]PAV31005.1 VanZ family protein [Virgibacillus profundi]PXY55190.1 VanZ family protein [Virgibacillus profundi]
MRRFLYWLLPLTWMGVIFYSSSTPYEKQNIKPLLFETIDLSFLEPFLSWISFTYHHSVVSIETHGVAGFIEFFIRKGAHVGVFFVLLCLFYIALKKTAGILFRTTLFISFFLTAAYAILDEIHQGFTPNRTPYIGDVLLDSVGGLLAAGFLFVFHRWKKKNNVKKPKKI